MDTEDAELSIVVGSGRDVFTTGTWFRDSGWGEGGGSEKASDSAAYNINEEIRMGRSRTKHTAKRFSSSLFPAMVETRE